MQLSVGQCLIIAIWVGLVMSRVFIGGASTTLRFTPMMTGLVCGIVLGDVKTAMITTASIQLLYMGVFSPGGQMPSEPCVATALAVPVAILGKLDPAAAVIVAVPIGLLGSYLYQFRFFVNTFVVKLTDKYAAKGDHNGLTLSVVVIPVLVSWVIFMPFIFLSLYYGASAIANFVQANSSTVLFHILSVIGTGLPAIGIALTIYVIGKKNYIVFFVLAYFLAVVLLPNKINMATYAIIGALVSLIFILTRRESAKE
ncbi:MAG: PTS sugar transporter subunit IIC [Oscillospiraceae bacterium]|nr:PTS sugar transporter subunit IIC [Oscillospiraceae bacterium]